MAATLEAPTLFTIAQGLEEMVVLVNVDETDMGRIKYGQEAYFTVDALSGPVLSGVVSEIRLAASDERGQDRAGGHRAEFPETHSFEDQTSQENLLMTLKNKRGWSGMLFYRPSSEDLEKVEELAAEIGLKDELTRKSGQLSHGQKQWLEIRMLLAQEPRLLLGDEPAAGMTPQEREDTTDLLGQAAKTRAVAVVEHDMEFVRRLNCKVTVLFEGTVLAEGSLDQMTSNQDVIDVYLGC